MKIVEQILKSPRNSRMRARPTIITWKHTKMIRRNSFLKTAESICLFAKKKDVTKVGIVGEEGSGKTTLAATLAHSLHKKMEELYKIKFAVRIFFEQDLLNFKETLKTLEPANYILIFDDVSFMEGSANKNQIAAVKQAVTKIRHLQGGQDVKIILINNYHYTKGLDKYLRQSHFRYFTTVGSEETENLEKIVTGKYAGIVKEFVKVQDQCMKKEYWHVNLGGKEYFRYDWQNPFIPVLFFDNVTLRAVVSPTREFIDPVCSICSNAVGIRHLESSSEEVATDGELKWGKQVFKSAVKLKLLENGLNTYGRTYTQAKRWLDTQLSNNVVSFEDLMIHYGLKQTKTRVDKQYRYLTKDDELKAHDDTIKDDSGLQ